MAVSLRYSGNVQRCRVCRVYGAPPSSSSASSLSSSGYNNPLLTSNNSLDSNLRCCLNCGVRDNIWVCLVCAHTGCGRYTSRHAEQHFNESGHPFSLELATGRVWDYLQDTFVHDEGSQSIGAFEFLNDELVVNNTPQAENSSGLGMKESGGRLGSLVSSSDLDDQLGQELNGNTNSNASKMRLLVNEYEALLESQLIDQRLYYEKQLAREMMEAFESNCKVGGGSRSNSNTAAPSCSGLFATEDELDNIEKKKIAISLLEAEQAQINVAIREAEREIRQLRQRNDDLIREQKSLREKVSELQAKEVEVTRQKSETVTELEENLRDLSFYSKARTQMLASPLRDDIQAGTVTIANPQRPQSSQYSSHQQEQERTRKGGKRR